MIISRGWNCIRLLNNPCIVRPSTSNMIIRSSSGRWAYRSGGEVSKESSKMNEVMGALIWGWILYHCINDYDLITGEFSAPDPTLWTDEELGIPPDSEGLPS